MNRWQTVNYRLFLSNNGLQDSKSLQDAFMSGYSLHEHVSKHGEPSIFESRPTPRAADATPCVHKWIEVNGFVNCEICGECQL